MLAAELHHRLGDTRVEASLAVAPGRCLALAGPSGAGKTTILRLLAGTIRLGRGRIVNGEQVWADTAAGTWLAPEARRCGYVFQDYALFPHLSAWRNVAYGLHGLPRRERRARAVELLERFGLGHRAEATPSHLSGGERQRVALARALAPRPRALLLDEPLSALDARSRAGAVRELLELLATLEVPVLLVTHDFGEAAMLGDEVAILDAGQVVQHGTASELAAAPATAFVADFTGAVLLTGTARAGSGLTVVELDGGGIAATTDSGTGRVALSMFPWEITISGEPVPTGESAQNHLRARITSLTTVGNRVRLGLNAGQPMVAEVTAKAVEELGLAPGREVVASWKATATRLVRL